MERCWVIAILPALAFFGDANVQRSSAQQPAAVTDLKGRDHWWWDGGEKIDLSWKLSADDSLFTSITAAAESVRLLMDDVRENPGRYISVSIF